MALNGGLLKLAYSNKVLIYSQVGENNQLFFGLNKYNNFHKARDLHHIEYRVANAKKKMHPFSILPHLYRVKKHVTGDLKKGN